MNKCEKCITDKIHCIECKNNPVYERIFAALPKKSFFMKYIPVCPRGYTDCINDPAYIKYHYPDWYKEMYGNKTPKETIYIKNNCWDKYINDPNEKYYCYDDEDK